MTAMIDIHAHWRPAEVADALRARTREPRILRNSDGVEVLKAPRMGEAPLAEAFDDLDFHLARMDRQGVEVSVLSLLGSFCWIEAQPLDVSGPLCRRVNDRLSAICQEHPGRFAAFAALPLVDISAAAAELERVLGLPGMIGAQIPGNAFLTSKDAEAMRPLFEVANRHRAMLFIHHGPRPGDAFPKVAGDTDNARRRNGTLDMQASLSSAMVTLCLTDYLADYPDATVCVHNLGGNIPYEVERMDHRCLLDTPCPRRASGRRRCTWIATRSGRGPSKPPSGCTAPGASSAVPMAPNLGATGPGRRSPKQTSARTRATRSCTATPPRCSRVSQRPHSRNAPPPNNPSAPDRAPGAGRLWLKMRRRKSER
ncbi:MAG: hypothetical protein E6G73_09815 [Alphaproteobacteria bacterium]|nr:MAG: hypothetical protein E6G73_09815 [Alphaproteobacteria bacterium]